jgi:hypothetical protein
VSSNGTIPLSVIWDMLNHCAPGHARKLQKHNWRITYNGKTFPALPLGEHGARKPSTVRIQIGIVRQMCRSLGILECAQGQIPNL